MAKFKDKSFDELFQKNFPLGIVPVEQIPSAKKLLPTNVLDFDEYMILANHMIDLCVKKGGVGLSAVQCGLPLNFFVASEDGQKFRCFLDSRYDGFEPLIDSLEGCLSIIDLQGNPKRFLLKRYHSIYFSAKELEISKFPATVTEIATKISGFFGVVLQHEIDHHFGKLISDQGQEVEIVS
jgi:peptide deformylase